MSRRTALHDPDRLAAVKRAAILDTPADATFDQLASLAARVLGAPIALVSILDDRRQFLKSVVGLPEPWASARETPLTHSICRNVVESGTPLVIGDTRESDITRENLAVRDFGAIAYAGVPLRTTDGHALGTLCVMDHVPRKWDETQLELLEQMASCVLGRIDLAAELERARGEAAEKAIATARLAASEERLEAILRTSLDAIITMDATGSITSWSAQAGQTFGWTEGDVKGRLLADVIVPVRYREAHARGLERFLQTGEGPVLGRRIEIAALHRDGREFPVELTVTPVRSEHGVYFSGFVRDITERREVEQALRTSIERFDLVSRATNDAVWDWDLTNDAVVWGEGFETLFGVRRSEVESDSRSWKSRIHEDDLARVTLGIQAVIDSRGAAWSDEYRFRRSDGSFAHVFDRGSVIRDVGGRPIRMVGAMMDVSERKRSEQVERAIFHIARAANATDGLGDLLVRVHDAVAELMPARNFYIALYDEVRELLEFPYFVDEIDPPPPDGPLGRGLTGYVLRTGQPLLANSVIHEELRRRGEIDSIGAPAVDWIGVPLTTRDRTIGVLVIQSYTEGVRYGTRELDILRFVSSQIAMAIERKRADEQIVESETRYRLLFEANPEAMWVVDVETRRFVAVNDTAVRRYGYSREEFLGMTVLDLRLPSDHAAVQALLESPPGPHTFANQIQRKKDGTTIEVELAVDRIEFAGRSCWLSMARDTTERQHLEGQLRQSQKMEAVGQLAGGIAHDFNNLLTAILGFSELLRDSFEQSDERRGDVGEILGAARRAASLTQQLLAFSRKQVLQSVVLDLNDVVRKAEKLLRHLIGESIVLRTVLDTRLGTVKGDPAQIEQVIMNLAVNARDAMPNGGTLVVETDNTDVESKFTGEYSVAGAGRYVRLRVSDSGGGIDPAVRSRLFEPFFTTKGLGKGTGLGLSTVYGIVKQSGGFVKVESEPGHGASFEVYLPSVDAAAPDAREERVPEGVRGGSETVLVVEDEHALRAVARRMLAGFGYRVLDASSGEDALAVLDGHEEPIHLMITDVIMPGISGRELAARVAVVRPGVRVLFMSGYADDALADQGVLAADLAYLQKPFTPDKLARRVREVLDAPQAQRAATALI